MKKLIAIVMMLLPMLLWAQNKHGVRLLSASLGKGYYIDKGINFNGSEFTQIGLGVFAQYNQELNFSLYYEGKTIEDIETPEGMAALIKLKNGEVITLSSVGSGAHWTTPAYSSPWYHYRITYPITLEQIKQIQDFGIEKIRIAEGINLLDTTFSDEDNTFFNESIMQLREKVSANKSLYDGF